MTSFKLVRVAIPLGLKYLSTARTIQLCGKEGSSARCYKTFSGELSENLDFLPNFKLTNGGGCVVQRKHSCFPPNSPGFKSQLRREIFLEIISLYSLVSGQY